MENFDPAADLPGYIQRETVRATGRYDQRKEEAVMYWRKPLVYLDQFGIEQEFNGPGWITVADSQDLKAIAYMRRGFELLRKYGRVTGNHGDEWLPILTHPDGPGEFPAAQVRTYGWHHPERLPGRLRGHPIYFPRLAEAYPNGVPEFLCPDCTGRRSFQEPFQLARHLTVRHGYDRAAILAMESFFGVELTRSLQGLKQPVEVTPVPGPEYQRQLPGNGTAPETRQVPVQEVRMPSLRGSRRPAADNHEEVQFVDEPPE